jgi:predicted membrane GTPase involved in stress response
MHLDLPLEQLFRRRGYGAQLAFATEAMERMPRRRDFVAAPSTLGLHVLAKDEEALEAPAEALRQAYGSQLDIAPPRVRLIDDVRGKEPIMHVEISVDQRYAARVRKAMAHRQARPSAEFQKLVAIMRYDAPLADLLGLAEELAKLTGGTAKHWMALSHYARVRRRRGTRRNLTTIDYWRKGHDSP